MKDKEMVLVWLFGSAWAVIIGVTIDGDRGIIIAASIAMLVAVPLAYYDITHC